MRIHVQTVAHGLESLARELKYLEPIPVGRARRQVQYIVGGKTPPPVPIGSLDLTTALHHYFDEVDRACQRAKSQKQANRIVVGSRLRLAAYFLSLGRYCIALQLVKDARRIVINLNHELAPEIDWTAIAIYEGAVRDFWEISLI
jgi:hypothetical protein